MDSLYQPKEAYHAMVKVLEENQTTSIKKTIPKAKGLDLRSFLGEGKDIRIHKIDGTLVNRIQDFKKDHLSIAHLPQGKYFVTVTTLTRHNKFSFHIEN